MDNTIIRVNNISKKFKIGNTQPYYSLRDSFSEFFKNPFHLGKLVKYSNPQEAEFWALKKITFNVERGEILGIIGANGSGKSTLLKIISRITSPTTGEIRISGKMSSLLEVGTGFNPELTGRENIYLNGAILGMTQLEIRKKFDQIVEFSGVEKFIDSPVKHYSSGMHVRLAFSVAAHLESEIMLIDEVLAVGDVDFQTKCLDKMEAITKSNNRTILFVSHNLEAVKRLCKKTILIESGKIATTGETTKVINKYLGSKSKGMTLLKDRVDRKGSGNIKFHDIVFLNSIMPETYSLGQDIVIQLKVHSNYSHQTKRRFVLTINTLDQRGLISCDSSIKNQLLNIKGLSTSIINCKISPVSLNPGDYMVNLAIFGDSGPEDWISSAAKFTIVSDKYLSPAISLLFPVFSDFNWQIENS